VTEVGGTVADGYEGVREAFARNFAEHGEVGATFAAYVDGEQVVDLCGGTTTDDGATPYTGDTLQVVFSSSKGAAAACANLLVQRGQLDLAAPVVEYWPEFGQAGKEHVPVEWLLTHQVGLPVVDASLTAEQVYAREPLIEALAAQAPVWEPGTAHGYHAITYGHLVSEVVRRVDGRPVGQFFRDEFAEPLGLDWWIGLPEEQEHRVAPMIAVAPGGPTLSDLLGPDVLLVRALSLNGAFADLATVANSRGWRAAEIPAASGVGNARALARFYAALIGGVEGGVEGGVDGGPAGAMLSAATIDEARRCRTSGTDRVLTMPGMEAESTFGLGFMTPGPFSPMGGGRTFGHYGAGGSLGFADPERGIAIGYVMNKMNAGLNDDPRSNSLIAATYAAAPSA
jgi:CubicO group peptidase (beta-lactamase class C family)